MISLVAFGPSVAGATGTGLWTLQSDFQVEITSVPDQVVAGESATVTARITNRTGEQLSATASVNFPGDSEQVTLGGGESVTVTLGFTPGSQDIGSQPLELSCGNAEDNVRIDVLKSPSYEVEIVETNAPVDPGQQLEFIVEVRNTGDTSGSERISYEVKVPGPFGELLGEGGTTARVSGGSSTTISFSIETPDKEREVLISVSSNDTIASEIVQIREARPPTFEVKIVDTDDVTQGEPFEATVKVENTGDSAGTKALQVELGEFGSVSREVQIDAGESTTKTFSIPTDQGSAGSHTLTATTEDDTASQTIDIDESPFFEVSVAGYDSAIQSGADLTVTVAVENTGGASGEDTVSIDVGPVGSSSFDVNLESGGSTTESVTFSTESGDGGEYTVTASSDDDTATAGVEIVSGSAVFEISNLDPQVAQVSIDGSRRVDLSATVVNTGAWEGTQTIELRIENERLLSRELHLESGEQKMVSFEGIGLEQLGIENTGQHQYSIRSDNDSMTGSLTVSTPTTPTRQTPTPKTSPTPTPKTSPTPTPKTSPTPTPKTSPTPTPGQSTMSDSGKSSEIIFVAVGSGFLTLYGTFYYLYQRFS
jgi:cell division septation protein DedD